MADKSIESLNLLCLHELYSLQSQRCQGNKEKHCNTYYEMASEEEVPNTDHYVYELLAETF